MLDKSMTRLFFLHFCSKQSGSVRHSISYDSYDFGCKGMMNLWLNGDLYVIPESLNTFLGSPRSHKYTCDVTSVLANGKTGYKHHFGRISTLSIGGSIVKIGARQWLTHLTWDWYQPWSLRKEFSWLSIQFTIISIEHVGISEINHSNTKY